MAAPLLKSYVIPITIVVLIGLFFVQSRGSERIGAYFGPLMAVWFAVLAAAGLVQVVRNPGVLAALNPLHALSFLAGHGWIGFLALGSCIIPRHDGRRGTLRRHGPFWARLNPPRLVRPCAARLLVLNLLRSIKCAVVLAQPGSGG